ncbi:hypothetical protein K2X33_09975 [bacterium]|nr:hypothetical protein [bacterium]
MKTEFFHSSVRRSTALLGILFSWGISAHYDGQRRPSYPSMVNCVLRLTVNSVSLSAYVPRGESRPALMLQSERLPSSARPRWDGENLSLVIGEAAIRLDRVEYVELELENRRKLNSLDAIRAHFQEISPGKPARLPRAKLTGHYLVERPIEIECMETIDSGPLYLVRGQKLDNHDRLFNLLGREALLTVDGQILSF